MRILAFEFACGGMGGEEIDFPNSVLVEGFSMLKLIVDNLKNSGHEVITTLDSRVRVKPKINADSVIEIEPAAGDILLEKLAMIVDSGRIDYVFPIAPDPELVEIVKFFRLRGVDVIASDSGALETAADKWKTHNCLKGKVKMPKTELLGKGNFEFPVILKPKDGVACEGLFKIDDYDAFPNLKNNEDYLIQEFIDGIHASVIVCSNGENAISLSLNKQNIEFGGESHYRGGIVPFEHPLKENAFEAAKKAVESIRGLKGCVGVDLVLAEEDVFVMEINPRITTSMIALHIASGFNVAEASLNSLSGKLPALPKFNKTIAFGHVVDAKENLWAGPIRYGNLTGSDSIGLEIKEI